MKSMPVLQFSDGIAWQFNRPHVMGVINLNDDSFYQGSCSFEQSDFIDKVGEMLPFMDILDLGGESTRPGAEMITWELELKRILPNLELVKKIYPDLKISVDTYKPEVAKECIVHGADMINDISAGEFSKGEIFSICANSNIPLVLMHKKGLPKTMQKDVDYSDVVEEVYEYLCKRVEIAKSCGILESQLLIDIGIGFGKKLNHNLDLLKSLPKFKDIGVGVLIGASRKSMLGELTGRAVEDRLVASVAVHLASLSHGAHVVRCHDVHAMQDAIKVYFSIFNYEEEQTKEKQTIATNENV